MMDEEVRRRLVELALTDIECDKDGHGDCSMCEYRYTNDECAKYYSGIMVDFFIKNGVTIRERGEWKDNHCTVCGMTPIGEETWTYYGLTPPKFEWWMGFCPICGADLRGVKDE